MQHNTDNPNFAKMLAVNHRAKIYPEERKAMERQLGDGAIKFKLNKGGMRKLMAVLDSEGNGGAAG